MERNCTLVIEGHYYLVKEYQFILFCGVCRDFGLNYYKDGWMLTVFNTTHSKFISFVKKNAFL